MELSPDLEWAHAAPPWLSRELRQPGVSEALSVAEPLLECGLAGGLEHSGQLQARGRLRTGW